MNQQRNLDLASIVTVVEAIPSFQVGQYNVILPSEIIPEREIEENVTESEVQKSNIKRKQKYALFSFSEIQCTRDFHPGGRRVDLMIWLIIKVIQIVKMSHVKPGKQEQFCTLN